MAIAYKSWVSETGTLTGTDPTYTLPNTATTGSGNQYLRTVGSAFTAATDIVLTISNSSGAETSVWSFTPGTGGAAGTITRSQLIESTTGSAINWSSATVTLECANPAPVQTSAGATNAGLLAALNGSGQFDSSFVAPAASVSMSGLWIANAFGQIDATYGDAGASYYGAGWQNYFPFWWTGGKPITAVGCQITTAATTGGTLKAGIMSITGQAAGSLLVDLTATNQISTASTGFQSATLGTPYTLAPGFYFLQVVTATGSTDYNLATFRYYSSIVSALLYGGAGGNLNKRATVLANNGATTLASSFSSSTAGGAGLPDFQLST